MRREPVVWVVIPYINVGCGTLSLQSRLRKGEVKPTRDKEPQKLK